MINYYSYFKEYSNLSTRFDLLIEPGIMNIWFFYMVLINGDLLDFLNFNPSIVFISSLIIGLFLYIYWDSTWLKSSQIKVILLSMSNLMMSLMMVINLFILFKVYLFGHAQPHEFKKIQDVLIIIFFLAGLFFVVWTIIRKPDVPRKYIGSTKISVILTLGLVLSISLYLFLEINLGLVGFYHQLIITGMMMFSLLFTYFFIEDFVWFTLMILQKLFRSWTS